MVCPEGQESAQLPDEQTSPALQVAAQDPQFWLSLCSAAQYGAPASPPPHLVCPEGQESAQLPDEQTSPALQVAAQAPQFWLSLCSAAQKGAPASPPLHLVCPEGQESAQVPLEQTSPALQLAPQAPQFLASPERSTHLPLHSVSLGPQMLLSGPISSWDGGASAAA